MFYRDSQHIYRARRLERFDWLVHGFGTRLAGDLSSNGNLATLHQVHSATCIAAHGRSGRLGDGDCLLENTPGKLVGVRTADCLPVLLVDERHRAVAAVHAGWRGSAQHIAAHAVAAMAAEFGTRPEDLYAALGPAIGPCCYEVGPEVAAQFGFQAAGAVKIDLPALNRAQLVEAGVARDRIYSCDLCTMCGADEFHSYRRDRERAGRMYSVAGIR